MIGGGADFFETSVGAVTMRCDLLLGNVSFWRNETGEIFARYFGVEDVRSGLKFWAEPVRSKDIGADMHALLVAAVIAIASDQGAWREG